MPAKTSPVVRVTVDDTTYDVDFSDLTAIDSKDFRKAVGIPLAAVLAERQDADIDVIAGLVWLARRKKEPRLSYEEVAAAINFTSAMDMTSAGEVEPDPET